MIMLIIIHWHRNWNSTQRLYCIPGCEQRTRCWIYRMPQRREYCFIFRYWICRSQCKRHVFPFNTEKTVSTFPAEKVSPNVKQDYTPLVQIHLVLDSINTLVYTLLTGILVMTKQFKDYLLEVQDGATDLIKSQDLADELEMIATNDGDLYRRQYMPIIKNLMRKRAKGVYDHNLAIKLWRYMIDRVAKQEAGPNGKS